MTVSHNLTIQGVGGAVNMVATVQPPNGKAIIEEGGPGVTVTLNGLTLSGAVVGSGNGAGVRYDGGTLFMNNDTVTGNQDGLLSAPDPQGAITIDHSTFTANGSGTGGTHNIYVGAVNSLTVTNSTISDSIVGHDIKSRAANTTVTNNVITDTNGTGSYEVDLPQGGNAVISNNTIEKGANAQNPIAIAYGEEGSLYANGSLTVSNNLMVNDFTAHSTYAVNNTTSTTASVTGNTFYGWSNLTSGPATLSGNTVATTEPALTAPGTTTTGSTGGGSPPPPSTPPSGVTLGSGPDSLVLQVAEDAYGGDAQFTVAVDGAQIGGTQTATASHAAGQSQAFTVLGAFGAGNHTATVNFRNDAYGGSAAADRNLYVTGATIDGAAVGGAVLNEGVNGPQNFSFQGPGTSAATVSAGSGPDTLALLVSEDAYNGDAQFTVAVDGAPVGGTFTTTALHGAGQSQTFNILGAFGAGTHTATVNFLNDAWGGSAATDRNLYVTGATIDGAAVGGAVLNEGRGGPQSFTFQGAAGTGSGTTNPGTTNPGTTNPGAGASLGSGPDSIVLNVSEDAYKGDAQYTVSVDGAQFGGTQTASASHAAGQTQAVTLHGAFGAGPHTVSVNFLNDLYAGTAATDRNLYVDNIVDGATVTAGSALLSGGAKAFFIGGSSPVTVGSGAQKIVLQMAEDAWGGDAQFSVRVDGQQIGGTLTTTALHAAGQMQEFDIAGAFKAGSHQVAVSFLNDAYGGSAATDRNLFVDKVGGTTVNAGFGVNGTQTFTAVVPSF